MSAVATLSLRPSRANACCTDDFLFARSSKIASYETVDDSKNRLSAVVYLLCKLCWEGGMKSIDTYLNIPIPR